MFDFQVLLQMTVTISTATQDEMDMNPLAGFANPVKEVVKKRIFYIQADRTGSATSALTGLLQMIIRRGPSFLGNYIAIFFGNRLKKVQNLQYEF